MQFSFHGGKKLARTLPDNITDLIGGSSMRSLKIGLLIISVLLAASAVYAQYQPFRTDSEAYQFGYEEGYKHGLTDREAGLDFNYHHSHEFQSGISYNSYVNENFRAGYSEGYSDGYYSRGDNDYDRDHYYDRDRGQSNDYGTRGFVTVFTRPDFRGMIREFGVGRYPRLSGSWNDSISSISISGPVRVILFDKEDFRGARLILEEDTRDLSELNFDSRAASMIIEPM
jgi:hypothetical protein